MKTDFILAITQLAAERNLPKEVVFSAVEAALVTAFKKDEIGARQNISVRIHPASGDVKIYTTRTVVEEPVDIYKEMSIQDARKYRKDIQLGESISIESTDFHSGRIAAQTAKQVVLQRLREAEREFIFGEYVDREGDIVSGVVQRLEPRHVVIDLGKTEGILPVAEQLRTERYRIGQRLKIYLLEVNRTNRGPRLILSRSHPNLVRRLFELEVPEISNGIVEIKEVAREPGHRSKVAVTAKQEGLDPVGSCVGLRGVRIQNIVNELNGERIDVIEWNPNPKIFIANALSPAQVVSVEINEKEKTAVVVVPDSQLSLAIGKEGQNARLAARITSWRIDIKSATVAEAERVPSVAAKPAAIIVPQETAAMEEGKPSVVVANVPEKYNIPLEQLGLSIRTFNLLQAIGFTKIGHLIDKTDEELLHIKNFGQKSLEEVRQRLEAYSLARMLIEKEVELPEVEEVIGIEEEVSPFELVEEEVEGIPYEAPTEEVVPPGKAQIRFAEDIFTPAGIAAGANKKKGKKKKVAKDEKFEDTRERKGRRARFAGVDEFYQDEEFVEE